MFFIKNISKIIPKKIYTNKFFISNYFNSNFSKNILISHIVNPFKGDVNLRHGNNKIALEIGKNFHERGYQVDIIQYNCNFNKIIFKNHNYDLIFGIEPNFLKAIRKFNPSKTIYYATGSHYIFQNKAEKKRLIELKKRRKKFLLARRYVKPHDSASLADFVICVSNKITKKTYYKYSKNIKCLPSISYKCFSFSEIQLNKKWEKARNNFLWFGSTGAVHKGLDLLLEIFSRNPHINLFVCGNVKKEKDFFNLYKKELLKTNNINFIGWVSPDSEKFKELATKCAFTVLPSCSEGMSGSVTTCMQLGMIPIVSKECGLDINKEGILLKNNTMEEIENKILYCAKKDFYWLKERSKKSHDLAVNQNNINFFSSSFKKIIDEII